MEYSDKERQQFKWEFAVKKANRDKGGYIFVLIWAPFLLVIISGSVFHQRFLSDGFFMGWLIVLMIIAIGNALYQDQVNWRCPACKERLGKITYTPKACKHCGIELQ
jgi:hypothetical protein